MGIIKNIRQSTDKLAPMKSLSRLKTDFQQLGPITTGKDIYDYGVKFLNIIASFQDNNAIDIDFFKGTTEEATVLAGHINDTGRQQYGWVQAKRGEPVTLHNLYLGDVYGLWTETAAFWKEQTDKDSQAIIQNQLPSFIKSHRESMI